MAFDLVDVLKHTLFTWVCEWICYPDWTLWCSWKVTWCLFGQQVSSTLDRSQVRTPMRSFIVLSALDTPEIRWCVVIESLLRDCIPWCVLFGLHEWYTGEIWCGVGSITWTVAMMEHCGRKYSWFRSRRLCHGICCIRELICLYGWLLFWDSLNVSWYL